MPRLLLGDSRTLSQHIPPESIDAVVTDPPYELTANKKGGSGVASVNLDSPYGRARIGTGNGGGFMGKAWDATGIAMDSEFWREVLRVLKPGGHLLAFGGTRTYHRMTCAIEDAGFEVRDSLHWIYGTGFPKGLDVAKELVRLWSKESATLAVQCSPSLRVEHGGEKGVSVAALVQILPEGRKAVLTQTGGEVVLHVLTDTWRSLLEAANIDWSMTSLSKLSLADALSEASRFITSTASETTTDERTWSLLIGQPTSLSTTRRSGSLNDGAQWPAISAENSSNVGLSSLTDIPIITALGSATWNPVVRWAGWNVAVKPSHEPIVLARKPLIGTVAANVLEHGTGALNIDGCRIATTESLNGGAYAKNGSERHDGAENWRYKREGGAGDFKQPDGRWPANVLFDEDAAAELDRQSGSTTSKKGRPRASSGPGKGWGMTSTGAEYEDSGGASRFFYVAKPSRKERDAGLDHLPAATGGEATDREDGSAGLNNPRAGAGRTGGAKNIHPTVKPVELMRYLVRLVTPPGGVVLDPFLGSGTTGMAAILEGFEFVGMEQSREYMEIAAARMESVL